MPSLYEVTRDHRKRLLDAESAEARRQIAAYRRVVDRLTAQAQALAEQIEEAEQAGNLLYRQQRLEAFREQVEREITALSAGQGSSLERQRVLAAQGGAKMATDQLSLSASFTRMAPSTVEHIVATTARGPLAELLAGLGPDAARGVAELLVSGTATGLNPRVVAAQMRRHFGLTLTRALTISRTEIIRAHREATMETYRASGVVTGYQWLSARSARTCAACWAMDGKRFPLDYSLNDHINGRCTLVPITDPRATSAYGIPDKTAKWEALGPEGQRSVLGPSRFDALVRGDVSLDDFGVIQSNATWGDNIRQASLAEAGI